MPHKDITGQRSGRLVAIRFAFTRKAMSYWLCRCDCGEEKTVQLASFTRRPNLSCGCLHREIQRNRLTKHGMARTPEYYAWQAMHQRCEHSHHPEFKNYGARGIKVCKGWKKFEPFFADMGFRPEASLSIDRKDNDGNYSCGHCSQCKRMGWPMNCRWATKVEQSQNSRPVLLKKARATTGQ